MTTTVLPLSEARNKFSEVIETASSLYEHFTITLRGKPTAVIISQQEYEDILETLDILADQSLLKSIKTAEKQIAQGKAFNLDQLAKQLHVEI